MNCRFYEIWFTNEHEHLSAILLSGEISCTKALQHVNQKTFLMSRFYVQKRHRIVFCSWHFKTDLIRIGKVKSDSCKWSRERKAIVTPTSVRFGVRHCEVIKVRFLHSKRGYCP